MILLNAASPSMESVACPFPVGMRCIAVPTISTIQNESCLVELVLRTGSRSVAHVGSTWLAGCEVADCC